MVEHHRGPRRLTAGQGFRAPRGLRRLRSAPNSRRLRTRRGDRGGVFVEFAVMVPFMMLALALVWQVLLIGITSMYASHGAAEAARQASVTPDDMERIDEEARKRVREPWDAEDVLTTEVLERDGTRFARVSLAMPVFLPGTTGPWQITGEAKVVTEVPPRGLPEPERSDAPEDEPERVDP